MTASTKWAREIAKQVNFDMDRWIKAQKIADTWSTLPEGKVQEKYASLVATALLAAERRGIEKAAKYHAEMRGVRARTALPASEPINTKGGMNKHSDDHNSCPACWGEDSTSPSLEMERARTKVNRKC